MTLGIIGVTKTGAVSAIDSRRGLYIDHPAIAQKGNVFIDGVKKSFKLPGNKITIHAGALNYQVLVKVNNGKALIDLSDPLVEVINKFPLIENENSSQFAQRFATYLNEHLKEILPTATQEDIDRMRNALLQSIKQAYKNTPLKITYSSDFNGLMQHASVTNEATYKLMDCFTACLSSVDSLIGGYSGNDFQLYEIKTPNSSAPVELLNGKPFGFACVGEKGIAEQYLRKFNWEAMNLEMATQVAAEAIMQTARQHKHVGGPINLAIMEPGKEVREFLLR